MENYEQDPSLESSTEQVEDHGLWLTGSLLLQLRKNAAVGKPLMILLTVLGVSSMLISVYFYSWYWTKLPERDFYLLEDNNLYMLVTLASTILIYYCFSRAILEGYKAWRLLRYSETNDEALLEGSERLGKMFRWFCLWIAGYLGVLILDKVWVALAELMGRATQL